MKMVGSLVRHLAVYGQPKTVLYGLRALQFRWLARWSGRATVRREIFDFTMELSTSSGGISKYLFIHRHRELDMRVFLLEALRPGDRVLDVGANIGYYALMEAAITGPAGRVHAFEPDPRNLPLLRSNIGVNGFDERIRVEPCALGEHDGSLLFGLHEKTNLSQFVPPGTLAGRPYLGVETVRVRAIASVLGEIGTVDLLRMDIEGAEVLVLRSLLALDAAARNLLPRVIIFEVHAEEYRGPYSDMPVVLRSLLDRGYSVTAVTSADVAAEAPIRQRGYTPALRIKSDSHRRSIFREITADHAVELSALPYCLRTMVLRRPGDGPAS